MLVSYAIDMMLKLMLIRGCDIDSRVRVHIGNQLYDVDNIDTVIDMDTNKPNIVIYVKEK